MLWRQRGVKDIELPTDHLELPFFNLGPRVGCLVTATPRPLYCRKRDAVPVVQETGASVSD